MGDIVRESFQFDNLLSLKSNLVNCLILTDQARFRRATENYYYGNQRGCNLGTWAPVVLNIEVLKSIATIISQLPQDSNGMLAFAILADWCHLTYFVVALMYLMQHSRLSWCGADPIAVQTESCITHRTNYANSEAHDPAVHMLARPFQGHFKILMMIGNLGINYTICSYSILMILLCLEWEIRRNHKQNSRLWYVYFC